MNNSIKRIFPRFHEKIIDGITRQFHELLLKHPIAVVDVGTSGGFLSKFLLVGQYLKIIGFEPEDEAYVELIAAKDKNMVVLNRGLFSRMAEMDFYVNRNPATSSLLRPNKAFLSMFPTPVEYDRVRTARLSVTTLDDALSSEGLGEVDFIKLDTQGSELFILQGGGETLKNCFGIEVEVEFCQVYEKQPLFSDVDVYLKSQGYTLFDLCPAYWKRSNGLDYGKPKGQIIWADALYFKDTRTFYKSIRGRKGNERFEKVLRACVILSLYGYLDYALEQIGELRKLVEGENDLSMIESLEKILKKKHFSHVLPMFAYRNYIASIFYELYKVFRGRPKEHRIEERGLGNV